MKPSAPLLELRGVTKRFGGLCAVGDCSFAVETGHAHGIIGPNGAGKTTLFNLVTGIYRPDAGEILFNGENIAGRRPGWIAARGVGRTFQNIRLCRELSVLDNVRIAHDSRLTTSIWAALLSLPGLRRDEIRSIDECLEILEAFGLGAHVATAAGDLPYGLQRRLEIARAIALRPSLLLLDEPAAGLNSGEMAQLLDFLRWVRERYAVTIVMIEHHMKLVMGLCDRITVLDFGRRIADGEPAAIRADRRVIDAYLGEDDSDRAEQEGAA